MLQFICKFSGIITLSEDNGMKQQLAEEYCRFVNETFEFIDKNFENVIPAGRLDQGIFLWTKDIYKKADHLMAEEKQEELEVLVKNYLNYSLEYFKLNTPWQNVQADRRICCNAILNTVQLIVNLSVLMNAIGYQPAGKVLNLFGFDEDLRINHIHSGYELQEQITIP